jgi:hypothetical protein
MTSSFTRFLDHIKPQSVGLLWTSDKHIAEIYICQHTTIKTDKHVPMGLEPTISAGGRPQIYALDRAGTGTGVNCYWCIKLSIERHKTSLLLGLYILNLDKIFVLSGDYLIPWVNKLAAVGDSAAKHMYCLLSLRRSGRGLGIPLEARIYVCALFLLSCVGCKVVRGRTLFQRDLPCAYKYQSITATTSKPRRLPVQYLPSARQNLKPTALKMCWNYWR